MSNNNVELFGIASTGKIKSWLVRTDLSLNADGHIENIVEWGYVDGKKQTKVRLVKSGKNKGKANETSIQEQALLELESLYQKQVDAGYVTKDLLQYRIDNPIKSCMLASKYRDKKHLLKIDENGNFSEEVYIQPKLNGIRCQSLRDGSSISFISRTNKPFSKFNHLEDQILKTSLDDKCSYDFELFNPDLSFETIASIVNSDDHLFPETNLDETAISSYIYDLMGYDDLTFKERWTKLKELSSTFGPSMVLVETIQIRIISDIKVYHDLWKGMGYEGLMIRLGSGLYEYDKRSSQLMKYKEMEQEEAEILDIFLAPQDATKVMFKLKTNNPVNTLPEYATFECGIVGNKKDTYNKYFVCKSSIIGKYLTFDYQALSQYGVPLFPVGQGIREGFVNDEGVFIPEV